MLYLLISVAYYKQLKLLDQELAGDIEADISSLQNLYGYKTGYRREGNLLYVLGQEYSLDPRRALEFVFRIYQVLQSRQDKLYGFNLLLARRAEGSPETAARGLRKSIINLEADQAIWIEPDCRSFFAELIQAKKSEDFFKVVNRELPSRPQSLHRQEIWKHSGLARSVVRTITTQAKAGHINRGVFIHGPVSTERSILLDAVQNLLFQDSAVPRAPRLHTLFRRRSPFHPFLNSVDPFFLQAVPQYLALWERQAWNGLERVLWSLKPSAHSAQGLYFQWPKGVPRSLRGAAPSGQEQPQYRGPLSSSICPDYLLRDFHLAYHLYLSAYFRMMDENFLPALLLCEDVDSYHHRSLEMLADLLKDFYQIPSFIPVFTSKKPDIPEQIRLRAVESVRMRPLSRQEMARSAKRLYPGCELPQDVLTGLRKYARGKSLAFYHCLRFLEAKRILVKERRTYALRVPAALEQALPARSLVLTWSLISSLSFALKRLLFIVYLQSGLMDLWGLVGFLVEQGMSREDAFSLLRELDGLGLIRIGTHAIALFPAFRKKLRGVVLEREEDLEKIFVDHVLARWRAGEYPHLVLLFFLLMKTRRATEALEVLARLLKQKLDELDVRGVRAFLDPRRLRFSVPLTEEVRKRRERLLTAARLRCALLQGRMKEAEELYLKAMETGDDFEVNSTKGDLFLQVSRYLLMRGETGLAMQWVKKAVIQFQNTRDAGGEGEATIGLGTTLLADGKFEEALEYFTMSDNTSGERMGLEDAVTFGLRGITLFIQGNLSRAETETDTGIELCQALKRREWELFLRFLRARISFELGFYDQALSGFQQGLAVEALYKNPPARRVFYTWLGRSFAYSGAAETALRVLEDVEESWEKYFFLAECRFLSREYTRALEAVGRAISLAQEASQTTFPGERIRWVNGFREIEGRCFELLREDALTQRLTQSFQAYLWGLQGSSERAIEQLHSITRGGRIPASDPYQSLYNYFYACTLPDVRKGELDDSLTVLNKALKLLQQRASKIEESTSRWRYLNNNYWNGLLFAEARRRKMI